MVGFELHLFYCFRFSSELMTGVVVSVENGCVWGIMFLGVPIQRNHPAVVWVFSALCSEGTHIWLIPLLLPFLEFLIIYEQGVIILYWALKIMYLVLCVCHGSWCWTWVTLQGHSVPSPASWTILKSWLSKTFREAMATLSKNLTALSAKIS